MARDAGQSIPAFTVVKRWIERSTVAGTTWLVASYDDALDVLKGLLTGVPVDEDWYMARYPAVAGHVARVATETATSHFQKHGYFETRQPFAAGWRGLAAPVEFLELKPRLHIKPRHGRLVIDIERDDFILIMKQMLRAVPVDAAWYRRIYLDEMGHSEGTSFPPAGDHYAEHGYFAGWLPHDVRVDDDWYVARYEHVRAVLERGLARSAKDHFLRMGYNEGCRPIAP